MKWLLAEKRIITKEWPILLAQVTCVLILAQVISEFLKGVYQPFLLLVAFLVVGFFISCIIVEDAIGE